MRRRATLGVRRPARQAGRRGRLTTPARSLLAAVATLGLLAGFAGASAADPSGSVPTQQEVDEAESAVAGTTRDIAAVRAELALATERQRRAAVVAAQAAEAFNGARWRYQVAEREARAARAQARAAEAEVAAQQQTYADTVVGAIETPPALQALGAMLEADGISAVVDQAATLQTAQGALDDQYDAFVASSTVADVSATRAAETQRRADAARDQARAARDAARTAQAQAVAQTRAIAARKADLLTELARLQGISVALATARQQALEERAAEQAAEAAEQEQNQPGEGSGSGSPSPAPTPAPDPTPTPEPSPSPEPQPEPEPSPPPPAGGASAALAFARAQLGEPYRWGAAGPDAWDCSGLTMGAWAAGGVSLPHYSVAQYEQSTPLTVGQLQPGDLVFWGSTNNPSSIYHVALYIGNNQIIHAPRTDRPVSQESMYYWISPNFFARP